MSLHENESDAGNIQCSREQASFLVLKTAQVITDDLVCNHHEVAQLYADTSMTQEEIAMAVIPDVASEYPDAARIAVANAIRTLLPPDIRAAITMKRRQETARNNLRAFGESGRTRRHTTVLVRSALETMIRGNGRVPWTPEEKETAKQLKDDEAYLITKGPGRGKSNYARIAGVLNSMYHAGNDVRDRKSVNAFFDNSKKKTS